METVIKKNLNQKEARTLEREGKSYEEKIADISNLLEGDKPDIEKAVDLYGENLTRKILNDKERINLKLAGLTINKIPLLNNEIDYDKSFNLNILNHFKRVLKFENSRYGYERVCFNEIKRIVEGEGYLLNRDFDEDEINESFISFLKKLPDRNKQRLYQKFLSKIQNQKTSV